MTYTPMSSLLTVRTSITSGMMAPDLLLSLILTVSLNGSNSFNVSFSLSYLAVSHTLVFNLSRVNSLCLVAISQCIVATYLTSNVTYYNVTIDPASLNNSLSNIVELDDLSCNFVFGEFTQQSLLILSCVAGSLALLCILFAVFSIIGCAMTYHTKRKWTIGGALNKLYFQDDAISLSTTDPETYELMNRLGERKTATLAINDDKEYNL